MLLLGGRFFPTSTSGDQKRGLVLGRGSTLGQGSILVYSNRELMLVVRRLPNGVMTQILCRSSPVTFISSMVEEA